MLKSTKDLCYLKVPEIFLVKPSQDGSVDLRTQILTPDPDGHKTAQRRDMHITLAPLEEASGSSWIFIS